MRSEVPLALGRAAEVVAGTALWSADWKGRALLDLVTRLLGSAMRSTTGLLRCGSIYSQERWKTGFGKGKEDSWPPQAALGSVWCGERNVPES